jgi:hypothetical protein
MLPAKIDPIEQWTLQLSPVVQFALALCGKPCTNPIASTKTIIYNWSISQVAEIFGPTNDQQIVFRKKRDLTIDVAGAMWILIPKAGVMLPMLMIVEKNKCELSSTKKYTQDGWRPRHLNERWKDGKDDHCAKAEG